MKQKIILKLLKLIFGNLGKKDWKSIIYTSWKKFIKPQLEKLVEKSETKFDDGMLNILNRIIETFLNPEKQNEKTDVEVMSKFWNDIKLNWKKLIWDFWENFLKGHLEELAKRSDSKWDDELVKGLDRILEIYFAPKEIGEMPEEF